VEEEAMKRTWPLVVATLALGTLGADAAWAGSFDGRGEYHPDPAATVYLDFTQIPTRYLPDDAESKCEKPMFVGATAGDALDGTGLLRVDTVPDCAERFLFSLPPAQGSYRASVWMRHGGVDATLIVSYLAGSGLDMLSIATAPTGRTTSDGWVELASNAFSVDGAKVERAYLKLVSFAHQEGVEIDGLEIVPEGKFSPQRACTGVGDPLCDDEEVCTNNRCVPGRYSMPPLPSDAMREETVDRLESQIKVFYGGNRSRELYLAQALSTMEGMRKAKTAYSFWNTWALAIHQLHDWHTNTRKGPGLVTTSRHRLNACFFEGDADKTHAAWPSDPRYADILVSHAGAGAAGLAAGDRLVAIDGVHPIEWAAALIDRDWGFHVATDPSVFADYAEALGGPFWTGGALIQRYASTFTILRCDAAKGTCSALPETIEVGSLPEGGGGPDVVCDNRPFYHLEAANNPNEDNHYIFGQFFSGKVQDASEEQAIYGLVWDTLYGGGDPNGWVNSHLKDAMKLWRQEARGVILDHRAGNGGTLESAELLTSFVRPPEPVAVVRMPMEISGTPAPDEKPAGLALFQKHAQSGLAFKAGGPDPRLDIPVALILHRDGSASDYLPFGMKGAPRVRLFGPHATAGAFSTFVELFGWGNVSMQIASGDTLDAQGGTLIGHGVVPDEVILPRQSDLLAGKDTLFEAALSWVKQEIEK
jgi:hypothetical protein